MPGKMDLLDLIIIILATYRTSQFVSVDHGPFKVFEKVRSRVRSMAGKYQAIVNLESFSDDDRAVASFLFSIWHNISEWIRCPYCNGVTFSAVFIFLAIGPFSCVGWWIVLWLAVAGGQAFIQDICNGDRSIF
jgi:hypothetical protein